MIQLTNSHVRRLLTEKTQYEEELQKAKEIMKGRMQGILLQCKYQWVLVSLDAITRLLIELIITKNGLYTWRAIVETFLKEKSVRPKPRL